MKSHFPPVESIIELEPEEVGRYLLIHLNSLLIDNRQNKFHRYNELHGGNQWVIDYAGTQASEVSYVLNEAWVWLLREGFLAPVPDEHSYDWVFITRRGRKIKNLEDFNQFTHISLLPKGVLDPILADKVWSSFIRGEFELAIFAAFKEVEVRIRKAANLTSKDIGVDLARKAFHPDTGALTDYSNSDKGERQAYSDLFAGALGAFKNPSSHRDVDYDKPVIAASLILHANTLLQIIENRTSKAIEDDMDNQKLQASA